MYRNSRRSVAGGLFFLVFAAAPLAAEARTNMPSEMDRSMRDEMSMDAAMESSMEGGMDPIDAMADDGPAPKKRGSGDVKLLSAEKEQQLRRLLPQVDDPQVQALLDDPRLMLYTDAEMPPAYQDWRGDLQGVHSPSYNISANGSEPFGNGNREFPWDGPGGTHRTDNVYAFRFLWLPRDEEGVLPVAWYRKHLPGDSNATYCWLFPVGTVFGEVLTLRGPDGAGYTFELRVRIREIDSWAVDVFRPFPEPVELSRRIKQLRPQWSENEALAKLVRHLDSPAALNSFTLTDRHPARVTFDQSAGVDQLPAVGDDKLVAELLTSTAFKSALGRSWRRDIKGLVAFAPTTEDDFHVAPARYDAGFIEVDRQSCFRCHETVGRHVSEFQPGRDWYGRIRGSDGIFSFHPFAPGSISYNGYSAGVSLRREFVEAGILQRYDARLHSPDDYRPVPGLVY